MCRPIALAHIWRKRGKKVHPEMRRIDMLIQNMVIEWFSNEEDSTSKSIMKSTSP